MNNRTSTRWEEFDPTLPSSAKPAPGCYVIFVGGRAAYVGQSDNVRRRMKNHGMVNVCGPNHFDGQTLTPWGDFPWSFAPVTGRVRYSRRVGEHLMTEARLIYRLRPEFNRRGHRNGR